MSEAPKEVWCKPYLGYDYVEDWLDGSWSIRTNYGGIRYVRADRIEELEKRNASLESLIKDFFTLLDKTEETDEGRVFRPNRISSCRVQDGQKLENLLRLMKATVEDRW